MPGLTELEKNDFIGSTGVRLREFLAMKSPQRQEILAALNVDHAKRKKAPIVKEKWVDPEDGFDEKAYVAKATNPENVKAFVDKVKGAMDLLN